VLAEDIFLQGSKRLYSVEKFFDQLKKYRLRNENAALDI
jgi:hypothetical protein